MSILKRNNPYSILQAQVLFLGQSETKFPNAPQQIGHKTGYSHIGSIQM